MYTLLTGGALGHLASIEAETVQCCVTSPPYWGLRRYVTAGSTEDLVQIGLEPTLDAHIEALVTVFREVRRVLAKNGLLWLNYGSMYSSSGGDGTGGGMARDNRAYQQRNERPGIVPGFKSKDLILADAMLAIAMQRDGWWLRSEIIWHKPSAMPESAADRPMRDHEKLFLLSKSEHYRYDRLAFTEPFRSDEGKRSRQRWISGWKAGAGAHTATEHNQSRERRSGGSKTTLSASGRLTRTVWSLSAQPFRGAHFATFPPKLPERCILLGSSPGDLILDPFSGAGTTGLAALRNRRRYLGVELKPEYNVMAAGRFEAERWMWDRKGA